MKGWKTVLFNLGAAILPVLSTAGSDLGLGPKALGLYALGMAVANLILRYFTTTPVGRPD